MTFKIPRIVQSTCIAALVLATLVPHAGAQRRAPKAFRIMIVVDGPSDQMSEGKESFQKEVRELLSSDTNVVFLEPKTETNWTLEQVEKAVEEALGDRAVDLVVGFGVMAGVAIAQRPKLRKPVLLPFAAPVLQGLPIDGTRSGRKNLSYIGGVIEFDRDVRKLKDIVRFERMAFIVGEEIVTHLKDATRPVEEASARNNVQTTLVIARESVEEALAAIPQDVDAVYCGILLKWSDAKIEKLLRGINARGLPTYAGNGVKWVERGALATMDTREDDIRRFRRAALYVQRIYLGERPETFDTSFTPQPELVINLATARMIGTWPRFEVMAEARVINETSGTRGPMITLVGAMRDALRGNLDLMAERTGVRAGWQNVVEARGQWLPGARATGEYTVIDKDIATPFGQAERQFTWGIDGSQLVYSPVAHGNLRAQKAQQRGVEEDYVSLRLDIMLEAGEAYLNVLRAKNNESVNKDNLQLARRNLALAESRFALGAAGREEVHRWQIEIADSRSAVISASALRNQAEIELNRVMNRGLEDAFQTPPEGELGEEFLGVNPRVSRFVEDAWSFKVLREFLVGEAIKNSPEIRSIDEGIQAQSEVMKAERRSLGIPDVSIQGGFQHIPHVDGVGADPIETGGIPLPGRDTFSWNVGVGASFTLFDGAQNYARLRRASLEVDRLQTERAAIVQRIEQRIRASLHQVGASFANIDLTRDAAEAAGRNLDMVTDSYQRGAVDIIRLIDAQNQALVSNLAAANAEYDYLIDVLEVERASGQFSIERTPEQRNDFVRQLEEFARERKPKMGKQKPEAAPGPPAVP